MQGVFMGHLDPYNKSQIRENNGNLKLRNTKVRYAKSMEY